MRAYNRGSKQASYLFCHFHSVRWHNFDLFKKLFQAIFNIGQHLKGADRIKQVKGSIKTNRQTSDNYSHSLFETKNDNKIQEQINNQQWNATEVVCYRRSISKTGREKKPRDSGGGEEKTREVWVGYIKQPDPHLPRFKLRPSSHNIYYVNAWNRL